MSEDRSMKPMSSGKGATIVEAHGRVTSTFNRLVVGSNPTPSPWRDSSDGRAARTFPTFSSTILINCPRGEANERATSSKSIGAVMSGYPLCRVPSQSISSLYCNKVSTGEAPGRVSSPLTAPIDLPGHYGRFESCS